MSVELRVDLLILLQQTDWVNIVVSQFIIQITNRVKPLEILIYISTYG